MKNKQNKKKSKYNAEKWKNYNESYIFVIKNSKKKRKKER